MKLKPYKESVSFKERIKDIFSLNHSESDTSISIDINGGVILENFKKIISCQNNLLTLESRDKIVYIHGNDMVLTECSRYTAAVYGRIDKVEMFPKEVNDNAGKG